jgi:hypothetical protein
VEIRIIVMHWVSGRFLELESQSCPVHAHVIDLAFSGENTKSLTVVFDRQMPLSRLSRTSLASLSSLWVSYHEFPMGFISWITYGYHIMDCLWVPYHGLPMGTISCIPYGYHIMDCLCVLLHGLPMGMVPIGNPWNSTHRESKIWYP